MEAVKKTKSKKSKDGHNGSTEDIKDIQPEDFKKEIATIDESNLYTDISSKHEILSPVEVHSSIQTSPTTSPAGSRPSSSSKSKKNSVHPSLISDSSNYNAKEEIEVTQSNDNGKKILTPDESKLLIDSPQSISPKHEVSLPMKAHTNIKISPTTSPAVSRPSSANKLKNNSVHPSPVPPSPVPSISNSNPKEAWTKSIKQEQSPARFHKKTEVKAFKSDDISGYELISSNTNKLQNHDTRLAVKSDVSKGNAFVPYDYAYKYINKVVEDMKSMKHRHVYTIHEMEKTYRHIENETQAQYDTFVKCMRFEYGKKVNQFKQVIDMHLKDTKNKQTHWEETFHSLCTKNNQLLKDKKNLLIQNDMLQEELANEKMQVIYKNTEKKSKDCEKKTIQTVKLIESIDTEQIDEIIQTRSDISTVDRETLNQEHSLQIEDDCSKEHKNKSNTLRQMNEDVNGQLLLKAILEEANHIYRNNEFIQNQIDEKQSDMKNKLEIIQSDYEKWQKDSDYNSDNSTIDRERLNDSQGTELFNKRCDLKLVVDALNLIKTPNVTESKLSNLVSSDYTKKEENQPDVSLQTTNNKEFFDNSGIEQLNAEIKTKNEELQLELMEATKKITELQQEIDSIELKYESSHKAAFIQLQNSNDLSQKKLEESEKKVQELEAVRAANLPIDVQNEIKILQKQLADMTAERDSLFTDKSNCQLEYQEMVANVDDLEKQLDDEKRITTDLNEKLNAIEYDLQSKEEIPEEDLKNATEDEKEEFNGMDVDIKTNEETTDTDVLKDATEGKKSKEVGHKQISRQPISSKPDNKKEKLLQDRIKDLNIKNKELENKIKSLENDLKTASKGTNDAESERERKKTEKQMKENEKKIDALSKKNEKNESNLKKQEEELANLKKDNESKETELKTLKSELSILGGAANDKVELEKKNEQMSAELKQTNNMLKEVTKNYETERILRKKYFNMIEDMKGKIRVYVRVRPLSKSELERGNYSVAKSPDEYSLELDAARGVKQFSFDHVFMPDAKQEAVFDDTYNLIQSAVDGYNVCIFAYGQTGSGKTFTMIGNTQLPGIAPRAFNRIYQLIDENKSKFSFKVSVYMLELYNDRLIDLLGKSSNHNALNADEKEKLEIKKDTKGMVVIQGSEMVDAPDAEALMSIFENGSKRRHVSSTKMNSESSRSHLIIGIIIESTNLASGQIMMGKLSLVDLAGSERTAKTGANAEQIKEAKSINTSLTCLGDVIAALSRGDSYIPFRNNKLTMLMQDSLGGNAKTLMFVNISPADYNIEESSTSLRYAERVRLITNDASKNAESKEVNKLKAIIAKMKEGDVKADEAE